MSLDSFRLEPDPAQNGASSADKEAVDNVSVSFNGLRIEITTAINTTGMRLVGRAVQHFANGILTEYFTAAAAHHWPAGVNPVWLYHFPQL